MSLGTGESAGLSQVPASPTLSACLPAAAADNERSRTRNSRQYITNAPILRQSALPY